MRINDKGKLDIGCYQRYRRESDNKKIKKVFYFSARRFANDGDPFKSPRRQELKFNKLLLRIVTKDYYEKHLK